MSNMSSVVSGSSQQSVEAGSGLAVLAAEWQSEKHRQKIERSLGNEQVLNKIQEVTNLIREADKEEGTGAAVQTVRKMDWDALYDMSAELMRNYTKKVDDILGRLDALHKEQQQFIWQEAALEADSHRGASLFQRSEEWMKMKESHLDFKLSELDSSGKVIKSTIERLTVKK